MSKTLRRIREGSDLPVERNHGKPSHCNMPGFVEVLGCMRRLDKISSKLVPIPRRDCDQERGQIRILIVSRNNMECHNKSDLESGCVLAQG